MTDKFEGQTMTEAYTFITAGTAHTFTYKFQPDMVEFRNLTAWTATAGKLPRSYWHRNQTTADYAFQEQVIDSSAGASFNFLNTAADGFTVADTAGGSASAHKLVSAVTQADPCVVTTTAAHGWQSGQIVRFTDLGQVKSTLDRGMAQLNNNRYLITVTGATTFSLQDPITGLDIDSTSFTAWVSGGRIVNETKVIALNNPPDGSYTPNPFTYDPILRKLTAGTAVMGTDGDEYVMIAYKWGDFTDLGDLLT